MSSSNTKEDKDLTYFLNVPWCSTIVNSPEYAIHPTRSRTVKPTGEDEVFSVTLNTPVTVPYCLTVARSSNPSDPESPISEVRSFCRLERGLNGYPDICHGGILALLFDELMGVAMHIYYQQVKAVEKRKGTYIRGQRMPSMTVELTVQYVRPARVPATVSVITWPPRIDGRKIWLDSEIQNEDGEVLSKSKALFVQLKSTKI